jgi:hypothetical protein
MHGTCRRGLQNHVNVFARLSSLAPTIPPRRCPIPQLHLLNEEAGSENLDTQDRSLLMSAAETVCSQR